ncbi:hypothetical protein BN1708_011771 [Verticillium longisporum]|uniref:NB-ARC domain-containing protein n=1 Tax=Verticillium longisporum TaxID=100787 RepID=A0A0G4L3C4_VERLO|nr:hypothetical protein BN1708_011771 [Verticillium longisporum]
MVDRQEIPRDGITCVYAHPDAQADIVFLHGLNGNPTRTWTAKDSAVYWPVDLLPNTLGPDAPVDVLVYGYNADTTSTSERSASDNYIYEHAQTLVTDLTSYRGTRGTATRPIIWVAHSLGGILLKRALNYSNDLKDRHHEASRSIFVSTFGIIFLGTPHKGSGLATWGSILQNMARATMPRRLFDSEPVLIKTLKKNNQTLRDINVHFLDIYQRFKIQMAHENHKTDFTITKRLVVDSASANPELPGVQYFGIEATHSNMCKFSSSTSHGYRIVTSAIREWVIQGPSVIERRRDVERNESRQRAIEDATERLGPAAAGFPGFNTPMTSSGHFEGPSAPPRTTPSLSTPFLQHAQSTRSSLFITPSHFHPDTVFVGRDKELAGLHTMLLDEHRRSLGTSAVVVQGMSGIGKSALGKQYIFNHKSHYPGGIYWIRASTLQEMEDDFWHIAKNDAIRQMIDHRSELDLRDPKKMVDVVRSWFNKLEGWLIIFDGIRFDDPTAISHFVPDNKNTSIVFTSTERPVAGSHLLNNPTILELGLLSVSESQELLLGELGKHKPYKPEDLDMAAKLVKLMDCLPLMIHSAAQQMKATREPLSKYLKSWKAKPHIGDAALPAFQSIRDDLQDRGETAALNLINILSFFGQLIPVEMLALGLKALDTRTSVKTKGSLNKTFATLIAFALIERSETAEIPSLSSKTSDNSGETQTEPLDTLWTHSVTQVFFANILADDKQFWLERAIAVFCRSFDEADARMKSAKPESKNPNKPGLGMPDDYRRYSAHGKRLLEHVNKMKKTQLAPELNAARRELRLRLESIPAELDRLQRAVLASIVNGDEAPRISVFQRSNSWSTGTAPSLSQGSSSLSNSSFVDAGRVPDSFYRSPIDHTNPHDYHVPYPVPPRSMPFPYDNTMPAPPFQDDDADDRTVTPFSEPRPPWNDGGMSEGAGVPQHRALRRMDNRRYRDRAGAWRDASASNDPRVSISRESVRGLFSMSESTPNIWMPSHARVLSESQAEAGLRNIKIASPPPNRGGRPVQDRTRSPVLGADKIIRPGQGFRPDYHSEPAPTSVLDDMAPSFFRGPRSRSPLSSQVASSSHSLPQAKSPGQTQASMQSSWVPPYDPYPHSNPRDIRDDLLDWDGEMEIMAPSDMQTSNSSPGISQGPFAPPILSVSTNRQSSLQHNYRGERTKAEHSTQPHDEWTSAKPWPQSAPHTHQPAFLFSPPAQGDATPLSPHPVTGYTSQPMSRYPSSVPREPVPMSRGRSRSRGGEFPGRGRAASVVETEPSPRLPAFSIGQTSYQAWEQEHGRHTRSRGDSLLGSSAAPRRLPRTGTAGLSGGSRSPSRSPVDGAQSRVADVTAEDMVRTRSGPGRVEMGGWAPGDGDVKARENAGLGIRWQQN